MQKVKNRIEKLLRLSLSNSPHEATLAAQRAIELMEKHSISRSDLHKESIIVKEIEVEYARVPGWVRTLYDNMAHINGCYMVWRSGWKGGDYLELKARIILVGIESDIENIDYYVSVLKKEITKKAEIFKKEVASKREMVKSYRMGLVEGVYNILYEASQNFNKNIKSNSVVSVDTRYKEAEKLYLKKFDVSMLPALFERSIHYIRGINDAKSISVSRPIETKKREEILMLEN